MMNDIKKSEEFYRMQQQFLENTRKWIEALKDEEPTDPNDLQFIKTREQHLAQMEGLLKSWCSRHQCTS